MRRSLQLKQESAKLTADYRAILDKASTEKRGYTAAEKENLDRMDKEFERLDAEITTHERQEERELRAEGREGPERRPNPGGNEPKDQNKPRGIRGSAEYHTAFTNYLLKGDSAFNAVGPEIRSALQSDSDTGGGYTVASEQFSDKFIQFVNNLVFMRQLATTDTVTSAQSLGVPTLAADPDDADWTSELGTGSEDSSMAFGKREFFPHPLAKRIKVSKKLLRLNPKIDDKVMERLGYKFAVAQEKAFLSGSGAQQPLGVFTATADGISTSRDVVTGSTTAILADSLFDALYNLKSQYQMKATWIFHRDGVKQIRKLKDSQNRYLWEPSIAMGQPATILDRPFYMSEYAPNTFTTGKYVGIIGDFSFYWIVDALNMEVQRLMELYAEANQIGFIGRVETDGMPVLEEAFTRLKTS